MWTIEEEDYLEENWATTSLKELADYFDKSIGAVSAKARILNLPYKCAARLHCKKGHAYPPDSLPGKRLCMECYQSRKKRSKDKNKKKEKK